MSPLAVKTSTIGFSGFKLRVQDFRDFGVHRAGLGDSRVQSLYKDFWVFRV